MGRVGTVHFELDGTVAPGLAAEAASALEEAGEPALRGSAYANARRLLGI